jgi:hypothetical protein
MDMSTMIPWHMAKQVVHADLALPGAIEWVTLPTFFYLTALADPAVQI